MKVARQQSHIPWVLSAFAPPGLPPARGVDSPLRPAGYEMKCPHEEIHGSVYVHARRHQRGDNLE